MGLGQTFLSHQIRYRISALPLNFMFWLEFFKNFPVQWEGQEGSDALITGSNLSRGLAQKEIT